MTILVTGNGHRRTPPRHPAPRGRAAVRALTRTPEKAALPAGTEAVRGDLTDTASLTAAFEGAHAAHHGQELWLTGPGALTIPQRVRVLGEALGRELRYVAGGLGVRPHRPRRSRRPRRPRSQ